MENNELNLLQRKHYLLTEIWQSSRRVLLVTEVIGKIKGWFCLAWSAHSCIGSLPGIPWEGKELGGSARLGSKCTFSSVLFSLELFCLNLENELTSNLLTGQFSPRLKACSMPVHVWLLPAPRHLWTLKHVSSSQKSRALLTCFGSLQDRDLKEKPGLNLSAILLHWVGELPCRMRL